MPRGKSPADPPPDLAESATPQDLTASALRASEARFRSIFSAMSEGLVIHDRDGRVIDANAAAAPMLGLTPDQLLGRTSMDPRWQAVHEDGTPWPGDEHPAMVALRTGREQRIQIMGIHAPGRGRRWLSINASPLWADGGHTPSGAVATFNDVTARLAMKERLERTEASLTDLYDRAPCGYHSLDADGRYLRINATELAWLGCTREDVVGRLRPTDFFSDEGRQTFQQRFPSILAGDSLQGLELDLIGRQGERRRISLSATPILGEDGRFQATRSILYDISDLTASRRVLEQTNAEQQHLLDTDLVGLARVRQRRFTWVNRGTERLFGYRADELVGRSTRVLYGSEADFDEVGARAKAVHGRAGGAPFRTQLRMRHKSGSAVWIDLSSVQLAGPEDDAETLAVFLDITPLKIAEDLHLQSIELGAQNAILAESLRIKNQFLANLSHELRTPLNAVIGLAQLMQAASFDRQSARYASHLAQIELSGWHLLRLIESMFDAARADPGPMQLKPERVDLAHAIQDVFAMLQREAERHGVHCHATAAPDPATALVDPQRLRQLLLNLVDNAIRFSKPGGQVEVRVAADGNTHFRIEIEDHGIGIAPADLAALFQPFHRLDRSLTRPHQGMGLGLALARQLAEAQGGQVEVRSTLDVGSTFTVRLPLRPASAPAAGG